MNRTEKIRQALKGSLDPSYLKIIDDSEQHIGHPGAKNNMGHFSIEIASDKFSKQTKITCHKMVYAALADLLKTDIHAISIKIIQHEK